jgi:hypothetical protein
MGRVEFRTGWYQEYPENPRLVNDQIPKNLPGHSFGHCMRINTGTSFGPVAGKQLFVLTPKRTCKGLLNSCVSFPAPAHESQSKDSLMSKRFSCATTLALSSPDICGSRPGVVPLVADCDAV